MIEIHYTNPYTLRITNAAKKHIDHNFESGKIYMDDYEVSFPGEYEKSGNLLEVKEYRDLLFYKFLIDGKQICCILSDSFDLTDEIIGFFGDVDVLIIKGSKDALKIYENIEAKVVIPYGDQKDVFLNSAWQSPEPCNVYKVKSDLDGDRTDFVNLEA